MDLWRIAVRALIVYGYLLVMTRISGKKVLEEATPFDFVLSLIVGDLVDDALWSEVPLATFATAVATIVTCDVLSGLLARRSRLFHRLFSGVPSIVLRDGVEDGDQLRREQLSDSDLAHMLRLKEVANRNEVRLGIVEREDELSVLKHGWAEPATKSDLDDVRKLTR